MMISLSESSVYLEARDEYLELRQTLSIEDAINEFMRNKKDEMEEDTDRCFCIAGLARAQAHRKELTPSVAAELGHALEEIEAQFSEYGGTLAKKDVEYFEKRIHDPAFYVNESDLKKAPKIAKKRGFRCNWNLGDTYAFLFTSQDAEKAGISGQYCIIRKVDEDPHDRYGTPSTFPIVYLSICKDLDQIKDQTSLEHAGYLIVWDRNFRRMGKYEYRIEIEIKSRRQLDAFGLIYLGNYPRTSIPKDEVRMIHWPVLPFSKKGHTPPPQVRLAELEREVCLLYQQYGVVHPELVEYDSMLEEK